MRLRLTPKETSFYDYFTRAAENLVEGSRLLADVTADDTDRVEANRLIREAEHTGDDITHAIMRQLNSTFVTPFDRADIYRLASLLDDVMDLMEAGADLVVLYGLGSLPGEVDHQVDVLQRAARVTADAMPRLRTMKGLEDYWIEVNRLENEADQAYRRFLARLFGGEYDALTVLKLKEIADQLEAAVDALEHVANTVETIVLKES